MRLPVKTILVPYDFSEASAMALDTAGGLLEPDGELHLVHILPPPMYGSPGVLWNRVDDASRIASVSEAVAEMLGERGIEATTHIVVAESAAGEICTVAEKMAADLVVIPTRGRTGLIRFAMGSVSEQVVRYAPCPVLVLRAPEASE